MILLGSVLSYAAPAERGVQVQVQPATFDFIEQELTEEPFDFGPYSFNTSYECYYDLTIDNFNLSVEIESVGVDLKNGSIDIDVQLGLVRGENIFVAGVSGWLDVCIDFDTTVQYVELTDGRLQGSLRAVPKGDGVALEFIGTPTISGFFDSEIDWFPDDIVWAFASDLVLEEVGSYLVEAIPGVLEEPFSGVFDSPIGELPVELTIDDISSTPDGLYAAADVDLGAEGGDGPTLDLEGDGESHVAIGVTQDLVRDVLSVAWESGVLEDGAESTEDLVDDLLSELGLPEGVTTSFEIGEIPEIAIDSEKLTLEMPSASLAAYDGDEKLFEMVLDLDGELSPDIDARSGAILLTAHEIGIDVIELDADNLVEDEEGEKNLTSFLEGWVVDAVGTAFRETPLFGSIFDTFGYVVRLDEVQLQDEGAAAWVTLFRSDDPEVDLEPPDTDAEVNEDKGTAHVEGDDDREGDLLFSWRIDGDSWSMWSDEQDIELPDDLSEGSHIFEAIARDSWQNEDPSPAVVVFEVDPGKGKKKGKDKKKGCGCQTSLPGLTFPGLLLLTTLVRRR